eukprot:4551184-Amphidinium_carterae.3
MSCLSLSDDEYLVSLKRAYGLADAPRHRFKRLIRALTKVGFDQSEHDPCLLALYSNSLKDRGHEEIVQVTLNHKGTATFSQDDHAAKLVELHVPRGYSDDKPVASISFRLIKKAGDLHCLCTQSRPDLSDDASLSLLSHLGNNSTKQRISDRLADPQKPATSMQSDDALGQQHNDAMKTRLETFA